MTCLHDFLTIVVDETRLRIIVLLAQEELCVCEICGILNIAQPKISKHLARLRDCGLVLSKRREKFIFYSLELHDEAIEVFIMTIIKNIDKYTQLNKDRNNLKCKESYFSKCKTRLPDKAVGPL